MKSIRMERDCVYGFDNLNSFESVVEDKVKVNLTLELKSEVSEMKTSHNGCKKNNSAPNTPLVENRLHTKSVSNTQEEYNDSSMQSQSFRTTDMFLLGLGEESMSVPKDNDKENDKTTQNDYFATTSCGDNPKSEFATQDKYAQIEVIDCDSSEDTLFLDISASLQKTDTYTNIDSKDGKFEGNSDINYNEHESIFDESHEGLRSECFEPIGGTCFSSELQMTCENQDFFSEQKECYCDHSYNHTADQPASLVGQPIVPCVTAPQYDFKHNSQIHTNMSEEFHNDQYENIEFGTIFSSVDIYQRPFDEGCNTENSEICHNFIMDPDRQSCEKLTGGGVFGLSLTNTGSSECLQIDGSQYSHGVSPSDKSAIDIQSNQNSSIKLNLEDLHSTQATSIVRTNVTSFSDLNTKLLSHLPIGHQEYNSRGCNKSSAQILAINSAALSAHYSELDKSFSDAFVYDPCLNDYNKNHQKCLYQSPQGYPATCTEWKAWTKGSAAPYDIHSPFICSQHTTDIDRGSISSNDTRDNVSKPETVQFLQIGQEVDEEETDDADEIEYLPIFFDTKNDHWSQHIGIEPETTAFQCDNSSGSYGPSVLTPPPSASSTPVPSSSQDSCISDDMDFYTHWPAPHIDTAHTSAQQARACKLKSEQLETGLLSFGLSQGTKRPFPSMADVMRSSRSKTASQKKCALKEFDQQPRRSGRPRKTQIQYDKISTTATSNKKKKAASKSKYDNVVHDSHDQMDSLDASSSKMSGAARHNEPLNQQAIEIMCQWFENHIDNPYPSKADKEQMAIQGGISENQVKSWFANKRNRTNNTKPKVQKRAMEEKLKEIFRDLKRNHQNPMADNSHVIQQLSGIIQHCNANKLD